MSGKTISIVIQHPHQKITFLSVAFKKMYFPSDLIAFLFEVLHPPGRFNVTSRHFLVSGPLRRFREAQQVITGLSSKADTVCLIYCNFKNHLRQSMSLPSPSQLLTFISSLVCSLYVLEQRAL